ncbi:response regulator transcription factor [Acidaminobacter sp. JC074]|uniref:response regulator transcription factor n=1 Tax=Acidaminobacter sp. JC074 TaxID=2530199 RepID=UPI001F0EF4DC|nr:response regulator transcription factor [Acidaminobacter sp. JC074]MCH4887420.1 response regulator transcription factor [Acidaminobacter sp. JC074]
MKRVLIIEDDVTIGEVEKDYFELAGFEVELVSNGRLGLKLALEKDFDLYILDVMLPDIGGFDIAKKIRETKNTPIMMVTAKNAEVDKVRGFSLRIDDYVTKPFSPAELVARAKAHILRYESLSVMDSKASFLEIRGLHINMDSREVFMNGKLIDLTKIEYELLILLAKTPNKIFTKEEIFQRVWGYDSDQGIPTIAVHIRNLREKLEFDPSKPEYIMTVWGVGYKMSK